jgi:hypothetical protein
MANWKLKDVMKELDGAKKEEKIMPQNERGRRGKPGQSGGERQNKY